MKKSVFVSHRATSVATSIGVMTAVAASIVFWIATSPIGRAQGTCTVCHKRTQTISGLLCDSLDYRRHLDHGDPAQACSVTPSDNQ